MTPDTANCDPCHTPWAVRQHNEEHKLAAASMRVSTLSVVITLVLLAGKLTGVRERPIVTDESPTRSDHVYNSFEVRRILPPLCGIPSARTEEALETFLQ